VQVLQPSNREQLPMELGFTVKQIGACRVAVQRRDPAVLGKADVRKCAGWLAAWGAGIN
jgi:hypothetical protein